LASFLQETAVKTSSFIKGRVFNKNLLKSLDPTDSTGLIDAFEENRYHGQEADIFICPSGCGKSVLDL